MTRHSDHQVDEMCDALIALSRKVGKGKGDEKLFAVEVLMRRFRRAMERDRAGSAIPDGYPRGRGFDGPGGGMRFDVPADGWEGESRIELTSVELAIEQRVFSQKSIKDHHHDLTRGAIDDLARAVRALDDLQSKLARIENLIDTNPAGAEALAGCRSHARVKDGAGRPYFEPAVREDGGRDGLCRWCFGWMGDTERNPDGTQPAVELLDRLIRNGRVTSRDIAETAKINRRSA